MKQALIGFWSVVTFLKKKKNVLLVERLHRKGERALQ